MIMTENQSSMITILWYGMKLFLYDMWYMVAPIIFDVHFDICIFDGCIRTNEFCFVCYEYNCEQELFDGLRWLN